MPDYTVRYNHDRTVATIVNDRALAMPTQTTSQLARLEALRDAFVLLDGHARELAGKSSVIYAKVYHAAMYVDGQIAEILADEEQNA